MKKSYKKIILFLLSAYLMFNLLISYVPINTFIILLFMISAFAAGLFLNYGSIGLNTEQKIMTFVSAIVIEGLILLISAFIFESGYILVPRQSLWGSERLISLYCIVAVLSIQELLKYTISNSRKNCKK